MPILNEYYLPHQNDSQTLDNVSETFYRVTESQFSSISGPWAVDLWGYVTLTTPIIIKDDDEHHELPLLFNRHSVISTQFLSFFQRVELVAFLQRAQHPEDQRRKVPQEHHLWHHYN